MEQDTVTIEAEAPLDLLAIEDPTLWALVFPDHWRDCRDCPSEDGRFSGKLEPVYPSSRNMTERQVRDHVVDVTLAHARYVEDLFVEAIEDYCDCWDLLRVLEIPPRTNIVSLVMASHFPTSPSIGKAAQGLLRELDLAITLLAMRRTHGYQVRRPIEITEDILDRAIGQAGGALKYDEQSTIHRLTRTFSLDQAMSARLVSEEAPDGPSPSIRVCSVLTAALVNAGGRVHWQVESPKRALELQHSLAMSFPTLDTVSTLIEPEPEPDMSSEDLYAEAMAQSTVLVGPHFPALDSNLVDLVIHWRTSDDNMRDSKDPQHRLFVTHRCQPIDQEIAQWAGLPVCYLHRASALAEPTVMDRQTALVTLAEHSNSKLLYWGAKPRDYASLGGSQSLQLTAETRVELDQWPATLLVDVDRVDLEVLYQALADLMFGALAEQAEVAWVSQQPERVVELRQWLAHSGSIEEMQDLLFKDRPSSLQFGRIPGRRPRLSEVSRVVRKLRTYEFL